MASAGTILQSPAVGPIGPAGGTIKGQIVITSGPVAVNTPALSITQTWNGAGVVFIASQVNVIPTASSANSLLQDWQVNGVSMANIRADGRISTLANIVGGASLRANSDGGSFTIGVANDSGVSRVTSSRWALGNGTALDTTGTLDLRVVRTVPLTVATLPAAATAGAGARAFVTDALGPVFGSPVAGSGAVATPVYSTGTAWNVG